MITGTYRCCNKDENSPCDLKWTCCNLFESDIEESIKKDKNYSPFCGVKCTACETKTFFKFISKFDDNGCGFKCTNERCNIFVNYDTFDLEELNKTGCIEEKYHVLKKEDRFDSIQKRLSSKNKLIKFD